jgi:serine/threonine-protein kinase
VERVNGKYAIERRLGGGGMAEVFLARTVGAEGFRRPVALKRILPGFSDNPEFARLFVSEAQLTSRLQHPNIVSILDFDRDDRGGLFLVMELVDGVDLDGLLDTGPLSFALVIHLAIEILSGLRYAHDLPLQTDDGVRGIVHRDISPHNVLVSWQGAVKVSDFGIAKSRAASQATASLLIKGKPAYMSPEQVSGRALDGRSDLFAVGVMLWQMLCQRPLFAGGTTEETITRLLYGTIAAPRVVCPDVPDDLSRAVMRLLSRDLPQRTPNADAAIAELFACADHPRDGRELLIQALAERFVGRAPVHARRVTLASPTDPTRVVAPIPTPRKPAANGAVTLTAPGARPRAPSRGRRRAWLVLAGAVLVTLVGGALWRSLPPRASTPRATGVDRPGADEPGRPAPPARPALPADPTQDPDHLTPPSTPAGPERSGGTSNPSAPIDVPRPTPDTVPAPGSPRGRLDPAGAGSAGIREIRLQPARAATRMSSRRTTR